MITQYALRNNNHTPLLLITLCMCCALTISVHAQDIHIPDPSLRAAVRETLNIADRPEIELDAVFLRRHLTDLHAGNRGISDLTGLEHATSLTTLFLHSNDISDIRPLSPLVNLTYIRLHGNQISDISPLAKLAELTTLALDANNITDISPLANLTQLTALGLGWNNITDIKPLANLSGLMHLVLSKNNILDITALANLTSLEHLQLQINRITDITPLANLTNLKHLELQNNRITDITPLQNLTISEHLDTQNNPIFDPDSPAVDIPDPNLRAAIHNALGLDRSIITQADMLRLEALPAERRGITDLTGIEYALILKNLLLQGNNIANLAPLATLTTLEYLYLSRNSVTDISPLSSLTRLKRLTLDFNRISDIRPLAGLTALTHLGLTRNSISDVNPLAGLHNLEVLHIQNNSIADHSPLDGLTLSLFEYDQSCEIPPEPLTPRLKNRSFPSIYARFRTQTLNRAEELLRKYPDYWDRRIAEGAYHDLYFSGLDMFQQQFVEIDNEWHVYGLMPFSIELRDRRHAFNPNMVFLAVLNHHGTGIIDVFPDDHPYWLREANGEIALRGDSKHARLINFAHPVVQDIIVGQALAVARCGLYDGIYFDWWDDSRSTVGDLIPLDVAQRARMNIVRRIREATRPDFIMMGNVNHRIMPLTGPFMNAGDMESSVFQDHTGDILEARLTRVENSLRWLEQNLREPTLNAFQGGSDPNESPDSPKNRRYMRATTTLSLTHSDGYVVFGIENHDHKYWYDFWDVDLGQPVGPKSQLYDEDIPGLYIREFTNGWAAYNHSGAPQVIALPEEVQGVASGHLGTEHALGNIDGEMYLRKTVDSDQSPVTSKNPADVNGDGVVNILDLTIVAQGFGTDSLKGDVNGDGVVNILDLVFVANQF